MMLPMRTTVTLDDDVAAALAALSRERGLTFKEALNSTLRSGLRPPSDVAGEYRVPARPLGLRPGVDLDKALRLAGDLDDEETLRKLALRK